MKTSASISCIAALGLLSLSTATAAQAAPAKVGVKAATGGVTVKVTNPNRYAIKGSVSLMRGSKKLSAKKAAVKGKGRKSLSLSAASGTSVTVVTSFGKPGAKPTVSRRTVKVGSGPKPAQQPSGGLGPSSIGGSGPSTPPAAGGQGANPGTTPGNGGGGGTGTNNPPPPVVNPHFTAAITGTTEQFGFTLQNGVVDLDTTLSMPVTCKETSGAKTEAASVETFDPTTGWALGDSDSRQETHLRNNGFAGTAPQSVNYKLVTNQTSDNAISGSLTQSFFITKKIAANQYRFWNCYGSEQFTATRDQ